MTVFRGTFLDTPRSPFTGGHLRSESDLALVVRDGTPLRPKPRPTLPDSAPAFDVYYDSKALWPAASLERLKAVLASAGAGG